MSAHEDFSLNTTASSASEDVWSLLFRRQISSGTLPAYFLNGLNFLGLNAHNKPTPESLDHALNPLGWRVEMTQDLLSFGDLCEYFNNNIFPLPTSMRNINNLEYSKTPDFFLRCFSQLPCMFDEEYRKILLEFGRLSKISVADKDQFLIWLQRQYWYSVEKGILNRNGMLQPIGAQLIDSIVERQHSMDPLLHKPYGMHPVIRTPIVTETYPSVYYVFDTWSHVRRNLLDFERMYKHA